MRQEVQRLARLAKLDISDDKLDSFTEDMRALMKMAENLPPLEADSTLVSARMALREDAVRPSLPREDVLQNAPTAKDGYFVTRKALP